MDRVEYGKSVVIEGLHFEYILKEGLHFWVHSQNGKVVYEFCEKGDGTYFLTRCTDGESWRCTTLSVISLRITRWEILAGRVEAPFRSSEVQVLS